MKKLLTGALAAVLSISLCTPLVYAKDNVETKTLKRVTPATRCLGLMRTETFFTAEIRRFWLTATPYIAT